MKLQYTGKACRVDAPIGEIIVNGKTSQVKLRYLLKRGVKLEGIITEVPTVVAESEPAEDIPTED